MNTELEIEKELKEIGERLKIQKSKLKLKLPQVEVQEVVEEVKEKVEVPEVKVEEIIEEVKEKVEEIQDAVEKLVKSEEVKTVIRVVEELPKTFQCCLPFLSKFWVNEKQK
jgi:hypothetical protein